MPSPKESVRSWLIPVAVGMGGLLPTLLLWFIAKIDAGTRPEFTPDTTQLLPWLILAGGLIGSGWLGFAAHSLQKARREAARLAEEMKLKLQEENLAQQQLQATLSGLANFQKAILGGSPCAMIATTPDGVIKEFSAAAQRMLGYPVEELVGRQTPVIFHDATEVAKRAGEFGAELGCALEPGFEVFAIKARRGLPNEHEWTCVRKDGSRFPVLLTVSAVRNDHAALAGYLVVFTDLSERKLAAAELLKSRQTADEVRHELELQRDALDQHTGATISDPAGVISHANERFCVLSGYSRQELIGQPHRILKSGIHPPEFWQEFWRRISAGNVWHGEVCNRHKNGSHYWADTTVVPFHDALGEVSKFVAIRTDITARKKAEAELLENKKSMETAGKSRNENLAEMSHEIRMPVKAMLGFIRLLAETSLSEKQRSLVEGIQLSGHNLTNVISDILDHARLEEGNLELGKISFDAVDVIERALETHSPKDKGNPLRPTLRNATAAPRQVIADPTRFSQVVLSLLGEAFKAAKPGGVTVMLEPSADASVSALRIEITVAASSSSEQRFGGTGLRFSNCKRLVELMGGKMGVTAVEGGSVTVWFTVPAAPTGKKNGSGTKARQVLVVDDNPINLQLACAFLAKLNCRATTAKNGIEATQLVQSQAFDLVLMDYRMPEMDGMQATTAIRHWESAQPARKRIPIVAVTANLNSDLEKNFLACGMDTCLAKPLLFSALKEIVARLTSPLPPEILPPLPTYVPFEVPPPTQVNAAFAMDRDRALQLTDNNPALLGMLAQAFLDQSDELMAAIRQALDSHDETALRSHAHKLKGSISVFATTAAYPVILSLNKFTSPADWTQLASLGRQLETEMVRLKPELRSLTSASSPP